MKHQITLEDVRHFRTYQIRQQLVGYFGNGENKSLQFRFDVGSGVVTWEVYNHRNLVCETGFLTHAVDEYNKL